jgi:hypothetical protein
VPTQNAELWQAAGSRQRAADSRQQRDESNVSTPRSTVERLNDYL